MNSLIEYCFGTPTWSPNGKPGPVQTKECKIKEYIFYFGLSDCMTFFAQTSFFFCTSTSRRIKFSFGAPLLHWRPGHISRLLCYSDATKIFIRDNFESLELTKWTISVFYMFIKWYLVNRRRIKTDVIKCTKSQSKFCIQTFQGFIRGAPFFVKVKDKK